MATTSGALPDGWLVRVSRSKGKLYYYNTHTKQTQWVRPSVDNNSSSSSSIEPTPTTGEDAASTTRAVDVDDTDVARKRQRVDTLASDAVPPHTASNSVCVDVPSNDTANTSNIATTTTHNATRARIAMSMRVGGSAFAARQSSVGSLARIQSSNARRTTFTPWDHQLEAIEHMLQTIESQDAAAKAAASHVDRFLLQHSTGAGKTMTIASLTYQLLYAVDASNARFHTIIILIDRVKLDEQVGNIVELFLRRNGIDEVYRAESSSHLAALMDDASTPQRVIVTTIHKLGLLVKDDVLLTRMLHRNSNSSSSNTNSTTYSRIAIITDEAHRSHTAATRETIQRVMRASERSDATHVTFVGFTATPNAEALELFGTRDCVSDVLRPFHCYAIARATADNRVNDVLQHYACVRMDVDTTIPRDMLDKLQVNNGAALRSVLEFASDDVAVLKAKAALMLQDFAAAKATHPSTKCMIVTRSRRDVLRYYQLVSVFVTNRKLKWRIYAAFSGSLRLDDDGIAAASTADTATNNHNSQSVTEETLNGSVHNLATSDVVVVCDKLDTGYNDPLLARMYIDRYLRSRAQTVQLTSRLNRLHKDKPPVRIVDFANHAAQIRRSYATFWHETSVLRDASAVDVDASLADALTAHTVLCDLFPILWDTVTIAKPRAFDATSFVQTHMIALERDVFHQALDALRSYCSARSRLEDAIACRNDDDDSDNDDTSDASETTATRFLLNYDVVTRVKKCVEAAIRTTDDSDVIVDDIKRKMAARASGYRTVFRGVLHPPSVLQLRDAKTPAIDTTTSLELHARGPLEIFEALLDTRVALDTSDATQVLTALRNASSSSAATTTTTDGTAVDASTDSNNNNYTNPLDRHMERIAARLTRRAKS